MRAFCILLFLLFTTNSISQRDSLLNLINTTSIKDSTYVDYLFQLSKSFSDENVNQEIEYLQRAKELSRQENLSFSEAKAHQQLASAYRNKGVYDLAVREAISAKKIYDTTALKSEKLLTNSILATLYRDQQFFEDALKINKQNLKLVIKDQDSPTKARYFFDLGNTYRALDSLGKAEENYKEALRISEETKFTPGEKMIGLSLGQLYKVKDEYKKAKNLLNSVLPYYKSLDSKANIALIYYDLATIASLEGEHKFSIPLYEKAISIYEELGKLYFVKDIYQKLFIAYNIVEDTPKANEANQKYNFYKDSLDNQSKKALVAEMKTKYETEQIEAENKLNQKRAALAEAENERNLIFLIASVALIILLIVVFIVYTAKQKEAKKAALIKQELNASQQQLALEKQYRDSELKALKAQMNPHFIFNVLNSIQEFIVLNKKDLASEYLATFAELIRSYLFFSNKGKLTLEEEIETLEKYLSLEQLRFSEQFSFSIKVKDSIPVEEIEIPTMLIQPYVENAVKHGLFHKKEKGKITIEFKRVSEKCIACSIEDNGIGRKKSASLQAKKTNLHQSFATKATEERLALINQQNFEKIGVEIKDLETEDGEAIGTRVQISIPIKNN
ncbi:tetratricopeptide repeat-containing sensor histidine kinase [Psychroflexus planctonicus]|uniref:Signal transduction histidine kinase internal region domain-containing protein n=1 Tax=Psychroflexus planctonicus TaxID=1526575 RepID=A0ABQ1SGP2_9FLAO|nr:histidine kinase [Psychroflexus planctonicus]GGE32940.1 hypothetical protein GCM10010832_11460 [Psychroflexus planctonicus]